MPQPVGIHAERLKRVRALQTHKGRREQGRFAFEGPTLLAEAARSGLPIEELYGTPEAWESSQSARELEASGVPAFTIDSRSAAKLSDLDSPPGLIAVARQRLAPPQRLLEGDGLVLVLADLNDPGNAGALVRSAEAFGCTGAIFGSRGADPYHPKVVRAAMGSLFRLPLAVGDPADLAAATGFVFTGLAAAGTPLDGAAWSAREAVVVGHERHGLGAWERLCTRLVAIEMTGPAESLNAAVAGSIALYKARRAAAP